MLDAYSTVVSELRYAILGRLLLGPATLPVLLRDLHRAAEAGVVPGGFTVADVVGEVKLYIRLGLVAEVDGVMWAVRDAIPGRLRGRVERLALELARVLGLDAPATAAVGSVEALT